VLQFTCPIEIRPALADDSIGRGVLGSQPCPLVLVAAGASCGAFERLGGARAHSPGTVQFAFRGFARLAARGDSGVEFGPEDSGGCCGHGVLQIRM